MEHEPVFTFDLKLFPRIVSAFYVHIVLCFYKVDTSFRVENLDANIES